MCHQTLKIDKLKVLISSKDENSQYLAACMLRSENTKLLEHKHLLKEIPVINRINTLKDVFDELGENIHDLPLIKEPKNSFEKYINACMLIPKIVAAYNEGWVPDWNDSNQCKYYPWFQKNGLVWSVGDLYGVSDGADLPGCFYFKDRERTLSAPKKFESIYNDWLKHVK